MGKENNNFQENVNTLMEGMDGFLSSKMVVGTPIHVDDTIIVPMVDVTFGMGAGVLGGDGKTNGGAGGMGAKMTTSAVLIIKDGYTRIINVSTHTGIDKLLDMVPELVDMISAKKGTSKKSTTIVDDVQDILNPDETEE